MCPPKDTTTQVNVDLKNIEKKQLTNETRTKLSNFAEEAFSELFMRQLMRNLSIFHEENRYYNWYNGYTELQRGSFSTWYDEGNEMGLFTSVTKGSCSTRNFGLESKNIEEETDTYMTFNFYPSKKYSDSTNITLFWKIEYLPIKQISKGHDRILWKFSELLNPNIYEHNYNFTPPSKGTEYWKFQRKIEIEELKKMAFSKVPGFKFSWYLSEEMEPHREFVGMDMYPKNEEFKRLANVVYKSPLKMEDKWKAIKSLRFELLKNPQADCRFMYSFVDHKFMVEYRKLFEKEVSMNHTDEYYNLDSSTLEESAKMFLYLYACPDPSLLGFSSFYQHLFNNGSPELILLTIKRLQLSLDQMDVANINKILLDELLATMNPDEVTEDFPYEIAHHPVHVRDKEGNLSPSAFIPFCQFGGNMTIMGNKIDELFNFPTCNCFERTILNNQLCYEVDLNIYANKTDVNEALKSGLVMLIDNNEDRQENLQTENKILDDKHQNLLKYIKENQKANEFTIYINSVGKKKNIFLKS